MSAFSELEKDFAASDYVTRAEAKTITDKIASNAKEVRQTMPREELIDRLAAIKKVMQDQISALPAKEYVEKGIAKMRK